MGTGTFQKVIRLGLKNERSRREDRDAERVGSGGVPLPSRLGGLGERRELTQRGPGSEHDFITSAYCSQY